MIEKNNLLGDANIKKLVSKLDREAIVLKGVN